MSIWTVLWLIGLSAVITGVFLKIYIERLSKTQFFKRAENIDSNKKSCIKELHKHKAAIPTMGGIAINLALLLSTIVYLIVTGEILWLNLFFILFGLMGFVDDYIKIKKIRDGVTAKEKLVGLFIVGAVIIAFMILSKQVESVIKIPFCGINIEVNVWIFGILSTLFIVAASNSVNITDGLDGLAVGICAIAFVVIGVYAYKMNIYDVLAGCAIMEGACLLMLLFNKFPAKVFMGDTGSLLLGGAIAVFLIRMNMMLWILMILGVCIFETISVILQVFSLKIFHKRIFKIAPFHHHLEKCNWRETTIVYVFWLVSAFLGGIVLLFA